MFENTACPEFHLFPASQAYGIFGFSVAQIVMLKSRVAVVQLRIFETDFRGKSKALTAGACAYVFLEAGFSCAEFLDSERGMQRLLAIMKTTEN